MSLTPGSAGPRDSVEGTMMVPTMPAGRDVSVNCEDNIAPKREAGDELMEEVVEDDKNDYHGGSSK